MPVLFRVGGLTLKPCASLLEVPLSRRQGPRKVFSAPGLGPSWVTSGLLPCARNRADVVPAGLCQVLSLPTLLEATPV